VAIHHPALSKLETELQSGSPITVYPPLNASLMKAIKDSNVGKQIAHLLQMLCVKEGRRESSNHVLLWTPCPKLCGADQLDPRVTIDTLPDDVLLETFERYLGKDDADKFDYAHDYDGWQTLVHVCHRWRSIVFASPRRLGLKLYCTPRRSVNSETLEIWPELPIVINSRYLRFKDDATNIISAFGHNNRVCKIHYYNEGFQDSALKEFAAIDKPFPALTSLVLYSYSQNVPILPDSFLGGSAPRLRSLWLEGISYPSIGNLLPSTTSLVQLSLLRIPHSGYIAPETIIPCLSTLVRLESLWLDFQYPRSRAHRADRHPPPLTRVVFPSLTLLRFHGNMDYMEDILSQIETPMLIKSYFYVFNQLVFDTPILGCFIRRMEIFMTCHAARVECSNHAIWIRLSEREEEINNGQEALRLQISCRPLDWQLSALAQVLNSFLSSLPTLESLQIAVSHKYWQDEIEVIQCREILRPFIAVKNMTLESKHLVGLVAPALQELTKESATEVLPALQNLVLRTWYWRPSGPVKEAIEQFIAARQRCNHPVTVHYQDTKSRTSVQ
jgi:hypothetical protein